MKFDLTEDQALMQKLVKEFAEKEVAPGTAERDQKDEFSRELYNKMGEMGLAGIPYPEEYGGVGGDQLTYILAVEEISKADAGLGVALSGVVSLSAWPIFEYGTEEQKQKYLRPICEGRHMGCFALTEASAGTDSAAQQTTAVKNGDEYIINGSKMFITSAGEAETYVVFAMTDRAKGNKGISAFILEKGMPGFTFGKKEDKMGIRTSQTMELIFQDVHVPAANLLGKENGGFKIAMTTLDGGRIGVGAQALGIAEAALECAIQYSKERAQFGKPICRFQALAFKMADMATKIEAARMLVYRAAYLKQTHQPFSKDAAMAKVFASDAAMEITGEAIQIYGGYGYTKDYPVERLMRDAKITQIYEGTNEVQRMVISGAILR